MPCSIEVLFAPAEFRAFRQRDVSDTTCVVFDVLRATSVFVTALANGAKAIIPVEDISEALDFRRQRPDVLLGGERNGLRITSVLTGGVDFDFGNSPRECTPERVRGKTVVSTTTNGTLALRACAHAKRTFVGSFLNLGAIAEALTNDLPTRLTLVCAGTGENVALEDILAAGALCERLMTTCDNFEERDSASIAHRLFVATRNELSAAVCASQNARRLLEDTDLRDDVEYCLQVDPFKVAPILDKAGLVILTQR